MFRPLTSWVIRKKVKVLYAVLGLALTLLLLTNNNGRSKDRVLLHSPRLDAGRDHHHQVDHLTTDTADDRREPKTNSRNSAHDQEVEEGGGRDAGDEYSRRQRLAFAACRNKAGDDTEGWLDAWPRVSKEPRFRHPPIVSTKTKLFFCPVGKVASSFFTRWVLAMNKPGPMTSPYDIAMKNAGRGRAESLPSIPRPQRLSFLQQSTSVVFGRNPYSRIFSAYVDKLFSPNPFYWGLWGKRAVQMDNITNYSSNSSEVPVPKCGSDVTFAQFVNAVVRDIAKSDVHLIPVSKECNVCQMPYNVVGKLETTVEDLDHASRKLNISSSFQHEPSYKSTARQDAILDAVHSAFSWKRDIKRCGLSLHDMGQRMWRKLQVRGVIDADIGYPLTPASINRMPASKFIRICEDAIGKSTDLSRLKRQRKEAMRLAYASVPQHLAAKIKEVYDLDFEYFGYDRDPDFIPDMMTSVPATSDLKKNSAIFKWETPWTLV